MRLSSRTTLATLTAVFTAVIMGHASPAGAQEKSTEAPTSTSGPISGAQPSTPGAQTSTPPDEGQQRAAAAGDVGPTASWRDDWKKWYCASNASPDHHLQTYPLKTGTLPVKGEPGVTIKQTNTTAEFKCGNGGFGYFHILARHYSQWQDLANFTRSGRNWLDGLNYGLRLAFQNPGSWSYKRSNDTSCYSSKVQTATDGRGGTRTWYPNAVVASSKRVITSYPSSKPDC